MRSRLDRAGAVSDGDRGRRSHVRKNPSRTRLSESTTLVFIAAALGVDRSASLLVARPHVLAFPGLVAGVAD